MALTLTNADIIGRITSLADFKGKANSGTTTTLLDVKLDDDYTNGYICFLSGANKGVDRIISSYATNTATFEALTTAIDNTVVYAITEIGFQSYVDSAYQYIKEKIKNSGLDITLFLTDSQLKEIHLYKTLDFICADLIQDGVDTDFYYTQHQLYSDLFNSTFNSLKADYDSNKDGVISTDEENKIAPQIRLIR